MSLPINSSKIDRTCGGCTTCQREHPQPSVESDYEWWPEHLVVEITNKCDLDCIMCERRLVKPDDTMSWPTFEYVDDKYLRFPRAVELSGLGEPTLAPLFPRMVARVYHYDKILYFPTNGSGLLRPDVLKSLKDSDDTRVSVSIDAATQRTYGEVRVTKRGKPGNLATLLDRIRQFHEAKPKVHLMSGFTAGSYNVDEFPEFIKLAHSVGISEVAFKPVRCWGIPLEKNSLRFFRDRTEKALLSADEIAKKLGVGMRIERPYYADGFENSGETSGFISYLDIVPLDVLECPGYSGTNPGTKPTVTTIGPSSLSVSNAEDSTVFRSKKSKIAYSAGNVLQILTDGVVTTCGAKHPIGNVREMSFIDVVRNPIYQLHIAARSEGRPLESKFCRGCEKMF